MDSTPVPPPVASLLVIDDSGVQRAHTVAVCRSLGVQMIYEAASGAEALQLLSLLMLPPDLLIVDLEMPGMDGIELIHQLVPLKLRIPLIVASGRELSLIHSVEAMAANLGLPVLAGLQKPVDPALLRSALARLGQAGDGPAPRDDAPGSTLCVKALAEALSTGHISVHYQPKVDMRTAIVRGVEALARWQLPCGSYVRPDQFVALAEREGLIHELSMAVIEQALAQAADWNAHGLKLSMAVNLSPHLLEQPSLVQDLLALVDRHGLRPDQVVLEVTETSLVDCLGAALGVLARLRLRGFGLSIDDYGTGFSSMQQLARIPFTELKIDRSFVHGAHQRHNLRVILQSALTMARQLDLVTVAEGIETLDDWRLLQQGGCSIGQGFLLARPMPAGELRAWLKRHQAVMGDLRLDTAKTS